MDSLWEWGKIPHCENLKLSTIYSVTFTFSLDVEEQIVKIFLADGFHANTTRVEGQQS